MSRKSHQSSPCTPLMSLPSKTLYMMMAVPPTTLALQYTKATVSSKLPAMPTRCQVQTRPPASTPCSECRQHHMHGQVLQCWQQKARGTRSGASVLSMVTQPTAVCLSR